MLDITPNHIALVAQGRVSGRAQRSAILLCGVVALARAWSTRHCGGAEGSGRAAESGASARTLDPRHRPAALKRYTNQPAELLRAAADQARLPIALTRSFAL